MERRERIGFVVPNGGGIRAFIHIRQFQRGSRRPAVGDLISYLPVLGDRDRTNAQQIRYSGMKVEVVRPSARAPRMPRAAIGMGALLLAVLTCAMGFLPLVLLGIYLGMSALSYLMYWQDKSAARAGRSRSRTPENSLHLTDLLGGWPGALIAQQQFHHKTAKPSFQWAFWLTVVLNLAACAWLVRSGLLSVLTQSFTG